MRFELTLSEARSPVRQGFKPDLVLSDHGVSGVSTRLCERPEGCRLFDILRDGDIYAPRGVGKTLLGLSIGLAVASGSSLLR
jgi:hypothetical protein